MAIEIDFMKAYDRKSIIAELQRVAKKLGKKTLTWRDIDTYGRIDPVTVRKKIGSMQAAHKAAGLVQPKRRVTDDEMLKALVRLWRVTMKESGRSPIARELNECGFAFTDAALRGRFGSWRNALVAAAAIAPASLAKGLANVPTPKRKKLSVHTRFLVFKRDGYKCRMCGRAGGVLEVDHVVPSAKGGPDKMSNLQTLCRECNRGKRDNLQ